MKILKVVRLQLGTKTFDIYRDAELVGMMAGVEDATQALKAFDAKASDLVAVPVGSGAQSVCVG